MTALKAQPHVLAHVVAAERVDGLRWNLILKNQTVVKLPEGDMAAALAELAGLQDGMQLLDRPVEAIDLRLPDRMAVSLTPPPRRPPPRPNRSVNHEQRRTPPPSRCRAETAW